MRKADLSGENKAAASGPVPENDAPTPPAPSSPTGAARQPELLAATRDSAAGEYGDDHAAKRSAPVGLEEAAEHAPCGKEGTRFGACCAKPFGPYRFPVLPAKCCQMRGLKFRSNTNIGTFRSSEVGYSVDLVNWEKKMKKKAPMFHKKHAFVANDAENNPSPAASPLEADEDLVELSVPTLPHVILLNFRVILLNF